jgi:hypothetical protein
MIAASAPMTKNRGRRVSPRAQIPARIPLTAGRPNCEARSALVVGSGPHSSLGKWSPPKVARRAKISSNSPGSEDYLVRKRSPVRIRAWAPSPPRDSALVAARCPGECVEKWQSTGSSKPIDCTLEDHGGDVSTGLRSRTR